MKLNWILSKVRNTVVSIERSVFDAWLYYNLVTILLGVFIVPLLWSVEKGIIFVIILSMYLFLTMFDYVKFEVGENDPKTFLMIERLRKAIFSSFWILLLVLVGIAGLLTLRDMLHIIAPILNILEDAFHPIGSLWFGTWFCTATFLGNDVFRSNASMKLQARARFRIVLSTLNKKSQKGIAKELPLFREALQISNKFLRSRFDFVIKEPMRFYHYARLMMVSPNDDVIKEIESGLQKVVDELKKREIDPLEILRGLKEIVSEPISDRKFLIAEVEIEPRLRKWFFANLQVITLVVETISLLVVVFTLMMGR
jgi:hypothetical protein